MNPDRSDTDLADVRRVLSGDTEAFEGIVRRWQGPLVSLAYRFCGNRATAEEMAQEAFLRAYRRLHRWRGDAAFSTWLFAVATNLYRSFVRRHRPAEVPLAPDRPSPGGGVDERLEAREASEAVRRAVASLPPRYRDAVILFYFLDLDLSEAALCLGVPEGTLKARLHRARGHLDRRLAERFAPAPPMETT